MLAVLPTLVAQIRLARMRGAMMERTVPMFRRQTFYAALLLDMRAAKEIRLFGLGQFFQGRLLRELRAAQGQERHQDRLALWVDSALATLTGIVSLVALAVFVARVVDGHGTVGDLVLVIAALTALQMSASSLVRQIAMLGETLIVFGHYVDITAVIREARRAVPLPALPPLTRGLEFENVWFRYAPEHDWVLRGLTLRIPCGSSLALVGDNGAGKSTVVKLLCGFHVPNKGVIRWDGVDITTIDPASLRARLGATFQDFMTYEFSAHDNIAVGDISALDDRARVRAAAATADMDATLVALPNGYDTMLTRTFSDGDLPGVGVVLSGGQWQRLALARALLREGADVLILDEPSSGLDVATEHEINQRLMSLRRTHQPAHLAPAQHRPRGGQHRRAGRRPHPRTGQPRRADGIGRALCRVVPPPGIRLRRRDHHSDLDVNANTLLRVSLLGPIEATVGGQPMAVGGLGRRALLAALAFNLGSVVAVNRLIEVIWDDHPPATATTKLQGHVCALRRSLVRLGGPDAVNILQTRPPGYLLCARLASTDLARFDDLTQRGAGARLPEGAERRVAALSAALRLWRGTPASMPGPLGWRSWRHHWTSDGGGPWRTSPRRNSSSATTTPSSTRWSRSYAGGRTGNGPGSTSSRHT